MIDQVRLRAEIRVAALREFIGPYLVCERAGSLVPVALDNVVPVTSPHGDSSSLAFANTQDAGALADLLHRSQCGLILCSATLRDANPATLRQTLFFVANPRLWFARVMKRYGNVPSPCGVEPSASVDPRAEIGLHVSIGRNARIGHARIGDNSVIGDNVFIEDGVVLGARVTVSHGAIIGTGGFGFERDESGRFERIAQLGSVTLEDDVEIGANASVDRATIGRTIVGRGTKVDALCYIAHNVVVGADCAICAHCAVLGGARVGNRCYLAPNVTVRDHVSIGDDATIGMGSVVTRDVSPRTVAFGAPARERSQ